jgi:hypothetical protein
MQLKKVVKDNFNKLLSGGDFPPELFEMQRYFDTYGPIEFDYLKQEDGSTVAVSKNFNRGSIVTDGRNPQELDANIKDAILTVFSVPSAYIKETKLHRVDKEAMKYAAA